MNTPLPPALIRLAIVVALDPDAPVNGLRLAATVLAGFARQLLDAVKTTEGERPVTPAETNRPPCCTRCNGRLDFGLTAGICSTCRQLP